MKVLKAVVGHILVVAVMLLAGCSDKPKEAISERKMVKLMADMQLAEAYANTVGMSHYSQGNERSTIGKGILASHGVTQEELDSTLAWYGRNIDDYTNLYEKVDKEINSRRRKIMKQTGAEELVNSADILWPYQSHGVLSSLGNTDAWILSLESPGLEKGDMLEWSLRLSENSQLNGVLGVEYEDGTSDASAQLLSGTRKKYELRLQTDTGKVVRRIYGTLRLRDNDQKPVYADSMLLRKMPFDSIEYMRYRSLRHYGAPARIKPKIERKDTLTNDTLKRELLPDVDMESSQEGTKVTEPVKMFQPKRLEEKPGTPTRRQRPATPVKKEIPRKR